MGHGTSNRGSFTAKMTSEEVFHRGYNARKLLRENRRMLVHRCVMLS